MIIIIATLLIIIYLLVISLWIQTETKNMYKGFYQRRYNQEKDYITKSAIETKRTIKKMQCMQNRNGSHNEN